MKKVKSLDDIWWKSICLPPNEVRKILNGKKRMFVFRQRFYGKRTRRWFWKWDHCYIRELWHEAFSTKENEFIYEADDALKWVSWKPPQQMPRHAARLFIQIVRIGKCRVQAIPMKRINLLGFDSKEEFVKHWDERYRKDNDKYETNPAVDLYKFRRITIKRMDDRPVVNPKEE
jgi:hypothetical protein